MAEISYKSLPGYLRKLLPADLPPVYLIHGDPYLRNKACQAIVDAIVPDTGEQASCIQWFEHADQAQVAELVEQLNTFSFFSSRQIVVLRNASVFGAAPDRGGAVSKIKKAWDAGETQRAADLFLRLLGRTHLELSDADAKTCAEKFVPNGEKSQALDWVEALAAYCIQQGLCVPHVADEATLLQNAVNRGFPEKHHLFLTTETVDKRTGLYKAIAAKGCIVDCSVAAGNRKKDREARHQVFSEQAREILAASGKKIGSRALEEIYELLGFDLQALSGGLEKLIQYTGEKDIIETADVCSVLSKSREEPIYPLTGAVSDKNALPALKLLQELLDSGYHYLQVLMALTNQIRRLLLARGFIGSSLGACWQEGMDYNRFTRVVMPKIAEYDNALLEHVRQWPIPENEAGGKKKKKAATELVLVRNPNNPFPVYQLFRQASGFTDEKLRAVLQEIHQADVALKASGRTPELILQQLLLSICEDRRQAQGRR
ncbi:MAG TPA: hypothetical protein VKO20_08820 [Desulfosalsimonadaceae bacterium]|nr:hypothetical protein [Desulfosalsimonadaceae bacterium]